MVTPVWYLGLKVGPEVWGKTEGLSRNAAVRGDVIAPLTQHVGRRRKCQSGRDFLFPTWPPDVFQKLKRALK